MDEYRSFLLARVLLAKTHLGPNFECVHQLHRTVLAAGNYEIATLPLKPLRPASRKDLSQLLLLVLKGFFALDLLLQFH